MYIRLHIHLHIRLHIRLYYIKLSLNILQHIYIKANFAVICQN